MGWFGSDINCALLYHIIFRRGWWVLGLVALVSVSSLWRIHSDNLHGFCHFHLNCSSHWWWLLFHLQSFPPCAMTASFFPIDKCPIGTIWWCQKLKTFFLTKTIQGCNSIKSSEWVSVYLLHWVIVKCCSPIAGATYDASSVLQLFLCWNCYRRQRGSRFIYAMLQWTIWIHLEMNKPRSYRD